MNFHFLVILDRLKPSDFEARCTSADLTLKTSIDGPRARARSAAAARSDGWFSYGNSSGIRFFISWLFYTVLNRATPIRGVRAPI